MLPSGGILPNPELGKDKAAFNAAIDSAPGTDAAKAAARAQYHDAYLSTARATLEKMQTLPGIENYMQWRERLYAEGKVNGREENQLAEQYMQEQKGRGGFTKLMDNISSNLIAGSHDLVAGITGTAGLLTGSQTLSEFAAGKTGEADAATAGLQHTGNDGLAAGIVGGIARAAPGLAATIASGGATGAAITSGVLGAGGTYADLYQHGMDQGLSHAEAWKLAAPASAASGLLSAALGKAFSGGTQALNNPATRDAVRQGLGTALKEFGGRLAGGAGAFLKGMADEVPEELLESGMTHFMTELSKGRSPQEATASFLESLPEMVGTAAALGGSVETPFS